MESDIKEVLDRAIVLQKRYNLSDLQNGTVAGIQAELSALVGVSQARYAITAIQSGDTRYLFEELTTP